MEENFVEGKKRRKKAADRCSGTLDGMAWMEHQGRSFGNLTAFTRDWMICTTVCL